MKKLLFVALGGASGSLLRYVITESVSNYPIAIFISNVIGVGIAGFVAFRLSNSDLSKLFWIPGFAGGLTTFSSVALIHADTSTLGAIAYFYGTVVASIALLFLIRPKVER